MAINYVSLLPFSFGFVPYFKMYLLLEKKDNMGFFVLIIGTIFGPGLGHIGYFAVYANYIWFILIFISLIRPQAKKSIFALHRLLWVVALLTFTLNEVIMDEAGGHAKPTYGLGLYLWFTAFLLTTIAEFLKQHIYQNLKENTKRIK